MTIALIVVGVSVGWLVFFFLLEAYRESLFEEELAALRREIAVLQRFDDGLRRANEKLRKSRRKK